MLNEFLEFEAYVKDSESPNPRIQPKMLNEYHNKKSNYPLKT